MIHAAIRRAVLRLDRNWISGAMLTAGIVLSIAGFLYLRHEEHGRAAAAFRAVVADRSMAVWRETESYQHLLTVVAGLAADGQTGGIAAALDSFRGTRPGGLLAVWVPWDGHGDAAPAANRRHRFTAGPGFPGDGRLPWLADALRCAARAGHPIAIPAAADGTGELLVLATPVYGAVRRLRGVALVMTPVADVVRYALGPRHLWGVDLSVVDAGLGGRQLYPPASRVGLAPAAPAAEFSTEVPFAFAGRLWILRASAASAVPPGGNVRARRNLLVAWLLTSLLLAAIARRVLRLEAQERRDAEQRLNLALDAAGMGIWDWDISAGRTTATPEIFRIFGLPPADTFPAHDEWLSRIHPDDRARMERRLVCALEANSAYEAEYRIVRPDGAIRWLLSKARLFRDPSGTPRRLLGVNIDITGIREAETALTETQERTRRVFANAAVGAVLADLDGRFVEVNDFACRATGYAREELLSMRLVELVHPEDRDLHARRTGELMRAATGGYVAEVRLLHRCGETRWMRVSVSPAMENGRCAGTIALWEDITPHKEAEQRLEFHSLNDQLTGLPNRYLLSDRIQQALADARRSGESVGVIYLDIDAFHAVNESRGHAAGDALLKEASHRLRSCLRGSDTLARVGGDEFAALVPRLHEAADAEQVARKLLEAMAGPFHAGDREFPLSASAGISLFPRHAADADTLLQHAHTAMSAARRSGRGACRVFTPELGRALRERVQLEGELRGAAARGEIVVHYQPEYDLRDGRLAGFEALARWKHPRYGMVSPDRFIPLAEESGLIVPIGMSVLEGACRDAVAWQKNGHPPLQVAVNVSSVQFFRDDFVDLVLETLDRTGLSPELLQLELTESVVLAGFDGPAAKMVRLRDLGIGLAVDDFGTGYSSLSYLTRLPFQTMKIDRSFVRNLHEIAESRAMIQSLVSLAHNLNLKVVVEGVERPEELAAVRALGCDTVQGYLLGRPSADPARHLDGDRRLLLPAELLACS